MVSIAEHETRVVRIRKGVLLPTGVFNLSDKVPKTGTNSIAITGLNNQAYEANQSGTPNSPITKIRFKLEIIDLK